ncbi:MAG: hypothetical protein DDT19_02932 [Syntrophomonadaceae bacterium]|nr:hypothetical protein [Bacillota bacterium]
MGEAKYSVGTWACGGCEHYIPRIGEGDDGRGNSGQLNKALPEIGREG